MLITCKRGFVIGTNPDKPLTLLTHYEQENSITIFYLFYWIKSFDKSAESGLGISAWKYRRGRLR